MCSPNHSYLVNFVKFFCIMRTLFWSRSILLFVGAFADLFPPLHLPSNTFVLYAVIGWTDGALPCFLLLWKCQSRSTGIRRLARSVCAAPLSPNISSRWGSKLLSQFKSLITRWLSVSILKTSLLIKGEFRARYSHRRRSSHSFHQHCISKRMNCSFRMLWWILRRNMITLFPLVLIRSPVTCKFFHHCGCVPMLLTTELLLICHCTAYTITPFLATVKFRMTWLVYWEKLAGGREGGRGRRVLSIGCRNGFLETIWTFT